jgi:FKBP-type peptidyl-prolyl cis-trans isomerase FklB
MLAMKTKRFTAAILLAIALCAAGAAQQKTAKPAQKSSSTAAQKPESTAAKPSAPVTLTTQKEKVSYAIGMQIGKNLTREGVDIDTAIFLRGLVDVVAGGKPLMTDEEARTVIQMLQQETMAKREAEMKVHGEANKKEGEAFLAENKKKEGVVSLPSGVQYKILQQGTGPKPVATDSVVCNYRGTFINGKEFDSSYKHGEPATFPVNAVIKGWTEILQLMPVGSKYQVWIPSELAYGAQAPPEIGPNATLIFDIELIEIKKADEKGTEASQPAESPHHGHPAHPAH